jgi:hypothetical protein
MILDIFSSSDEDERPPMAKMLDISAQFSRDQLHRMTWTRDIILNFLRSHSREVAATPDPWNCWALSNFDRFLKEDMQ